MKFAKILIVFLTTICATYTAKASDSQLSKLTQHQWFSGIKNCETNSEPAIESYQYDENSYILRQNKCSHYEAPFIYLLFGDEKLLVLDTGATADANEFPLAQIVANITAQRSASTGKPKPKQTIVAHSHNHSDHIAGDKQFANNANTTVIPVNDLARLQQVFSMQGWPDNNSQLDLGNRMLTIIPSPGHQKEAISIYDPVNKWLLTGDTLYPGRLYIRQWQTFQQSIKKLVTFSKQNPVAAILGAHIEMSAQAGIDFPTGSTYQPNEASLVLTTKELFLLHSELTKLGEKVERVVSDKFIIYPLKESY